QRDVVAVRPGAVSMTNDLHTVLVVLSERGRQVIERTVEIAGNLRRVGGEGDVARHDQLDVITLALHFHTGALHAAPQFGLLLVGVIAVTGPGCTGNRGANQRALAAI